MSSGDEYVVSDVDDISDYEVIDPSDVPTIKGWLKPTDYDGEGSEFMRHLLSHAAGTNDWLFSTAEWKEWHDTAAQGFLRLTGIPGSGKSVLAAHLAHRLNEEKVPVLFFFFRQIIDANHSPQALLRDWLAQLLPYSPILQAEIDTFIKSNRELESVSTDDLWRLLKTALSDQPKVYAIADALDEMDAGNEGFIQALAELGQLKPSAIKVLVTSRPVPAVEIALRQVSKLQVRLEEAYVDIDIARYVSQRLVKSDIDAEEQGLIRSAVPGRANGLFLYARLAMDGFLEPGADVQDVLRRLPMDLNCMYTDLLNEHARRSGAPAELQVRVLRWVTHASRPLRLLELSEIVKFVSDQPSLHNLGAVKALVRASCGPLIEILPDETLSVCHHSLTEFLKGWTRSDSPDATQQPFPILHPAPTHLSLALDCLRYLSAGCLNACTVWDDNYHYNVLYSGWTTQTRMQMDYPFGIYAATNWNIHATKAIEHGLTETDLSTLSDAVDGVLRSAKWRRVLLQMDERASSQGVGRLHVAAWAGLENYAKFIIDEGEPLDHKDGAGNTPLHLAASYGRDSVVSLLVRRGAEINPDNNCGLKPLHEASSRGHATSVTLLLQAGVDPMTEKTRENPGRRCGNAPRTTGQTPLQYACQNGHVDVVCAYLPFLKPDHKAQALNWASVSGQSKLVKFLTQQPGFIVDEQVRSTTALFAACEYRHVDIIHTLLEAGADPNAICRGSSHRRLMRFVPAESREIDYERGSSPMHAFAKTTRFSHRRGRDDLADSEAETLSALDALVMAGGSVSSLDRSRRTVLHHACSGRGEDSVSFWIAMLTKILGLGADANAVDIDGQTPLHMCLDDPTGQALRLLVEAGGADINKPDAKGCMPLINLLNKSGNSAVVLNLLKLQPNCNVVDEHGNSPLHIAVRRCRKSVAARFDEGVSPELLDEQVIAALLEYGADPQVTNLLGETPLHLLNMSVYRPKEELNLFCERRIIQMLLTKGANLETRDHMGRTFLFRQIENRSEDWAERMELLLEIGCDLHTTDFAGRGVLHEVIRSRQDNKCLQFFISRGADKDFRDHDGNTVLHEVAILGDVQNPLSCFESLGISPDQRNNAGQTPLSIASGVVPGWASDRSAFYGFLDICKDKNASDNRGIKPIHMASCVSEDYVIKLVNAGASTSATTNERQNLLHIAARARQSNIVGLLCELLSTSNNRRTRQLINAIDSEGRTPLHYACRSGRPETVAVLLRFGASTKIADKNGFTPFSACVEFEEESRLWSDAGSRTDSGRCLRVWEIFGDTKDRPKWYFEQSGRRFIRNHPKLRLENEHDSARLGEILNMLVSDEADADPKSDRLSNQLSRAMRYAIEHKLDYTFGCFKAIQDRLGLSDAMVYPLFDYFSAQYRLDAASKALEDCQRSGEIPEQQLRDMLLDRQYDLVRKLLRQDVKLYAKEGEEQLIKWGFADLLSSTDPRSITNAVREKNDEKTDEDEKHRGNENLNDIISSQESENTPAIIMACQRELSNTEILRTLSRRTDFQVNARVIERVYRGKRMEYMQTKTALHELADATHWWHVAEGIPFLLEIGADINARDHERRTPLHIALNGSWRSGLYRKRAAQLLIELGADVTVVDWQGRPCLAMTDDSELISLLVAHGAKLSTSALFNAVRKGNLDLLRQLLTLGVNPNLRLEFTDQSSGEVERLDWLYADDHQRKQALPHAENPVLFYAATTTVNPSTMRAPLDPRVRDEMVRTLLTHGADPYSTFRELDVASTSDPSSDDEAPLYCVPDTVDDGQGARTLTLIHQVIYEGGHIQAFLEIPDLNLELRDEKGCTLLLAACHHPSHVTRAHRWGPSEPWSTGLVGQLIDRGADVLARDNDGNNALHICLTSTPHVTESVIQMLIDKASHLVREKNARGDTPFHLAMKCGNLDIINRALPLCGDIKDPDADGNSVLHHFAARMARGRYPISSDMTLAQVEALSQAAFEADVVILHRFISEGVGINSLNSKGETPCMFCLEAFTEDRRDGGLERLKKLLQVLCDAGADIFIPDNHATTLLHRAAAQPPEARYLRADGESDTLHLFKHLVSLGMDPFAEDDKNRTSLDIASANGNQEILEMFEKDK